METQATKYETHKLKMAGKVFSEILDLPLAIIFPRVYITCVGVSDRNEPQTWRLR